MSEENHFKERNAPRLIVLSTMAAAIALVGAGCSAPATPATIDDTNVNPSTPAPNTSNETGAAMYKNGTYTAVGNYTSPAGAEEMGVTLTLANDVIVDANVEVKATNEFSKKWQETFSANYQTLVVGKKISEVTLSKVSGSSLTPKGFNDAVAKIQAQAKS